MTAGGCACGAFRYWVEDPGVAWFCHCRSCQRESGAPVMTWLAAGAAHVTGAHGSHPGAHGTRLVCPVCGGAPVVREGTTTRVALATLDEPDRFEPRLHVAVDQQRPWARLWDGLARVEGAELPEPLPQGWRKARDTTLDGRSAVTLRPIDDDNRGDVLRLVVAGNQMRFVAPNALSLYQEQVTNDETWLRAVVADEVPVGLCLAEIASEDELGLPTAGQPFLWRFMIDDHYQGYGFGRRAIEQFVEAMRERGARAVFVSAVPGTGSPLPFYERMGFRDTGQVSDGEVVLMMPLA